MAVVEIQPKYSSANVDQDRPLVIRSKAPLRISLAGGGTDVSPYSDLYGGAILNATVSMYAYATLEITNDSMITLESADRGEKVVYPSANGMLPIDGTLDLHKGVYNRILQDYSSGPLSFKLTTYVDAPAGSGLGTSSTLLVAILNAFGEWLQLPLGEYDLAHLAWHIERVQLGMAGGTQDQYAATFGGFNFMEFKDNENVIVNPLRIRSNVLNELEFNLLLYYTGTSRLSSQIIASQIQNVREQNEAALEAMHQLKYQAYKMKEAVLKSRIDDIGEILDYGWQHKKQAGQGITNPLIDELYDTAKAAGATGGKISGAGGGGFLMMYCPGNTRYNVIQALEPFGGRFRRFHFTKNGAQSWSNS